VLEGADAGYCICLSVRGVPESRLRSGRRMAFFISAHLPGRAWPASTRANIIGRKVIMLSPC
jgi:hypothetical protein